MRSDWNIPTFVKSCRALGKDRAVALMRRVEEFSGVVVLAYAFMSNHFHIFIYVPKAEEIGEDEILRRIRVLYRDASLSQVVAT